MKKKQIANLVMIAVILVIVAAGILTAGYIQGWFDRDDGTYGVLRDVRGVIRLERDGVSYPAEKETVLRAGDILSCDPGATATVYAAEDTFAIGEQASLKIIDPSADHFSAELLCGELFANCGNTAVIGFAGKEAALSGTTAWIRVRADAQSVSVLRGQVKNASAGQRLNYIGNEASVEALDIHSLNDFGIAQIRSYDGSLPLCFTSEELDLLMAERQQALQEQINSQITPTPPAAEQTEPEQTEPVRPTDPPEATAPPAAVQPTEPPVTETPTEPAVTVPETTPPAYAPASCTVTIRCDRILSNMESLEPGKAEFVPNDGVILYPVTVEFSAGETVFDILKRVCGIAGIPLEYSWNPVYESYYIEGINNLYEFDCGSGSGWVYLVNGWSPNYGCSAYTVEDGDEILWAYSCQGLGSDVG